MTRAPAEPEPLQTMYFLFMVAIVCQKKIGNRLEEQRLLQDLLPGNHQEKYYPVPFFELSGLNSTQDY